MDHNEADARNRRRAELRPEPHLREMRSARLRGRDRREERTQRRHGGVGIGDREPAADIEHVDRGAGSPATVAAGGFRFQDNNAFRRWIGCAAMRAGISASQNCGSMSLGLAATMSAGSKNLCRMRPACGFPVHPDCRPGTWSAP
jgi:hypothetical protein